MKIPPDMRLLLALFAAVLAYAAGANAGRKTERRRMEGEARAGEREAIEP